MYRPSEPARSPPHGLAAAARALRCLRSACKLLLHQAWAAWVVELTAVRLLPRKSFWRGVRCREQKFAPGVLGASTRPGRREFARFRAQGRELNTQASLGMNWTPQNDRLHGGALAPDKSKFEKLEIGPFRETTICAHFGRKLQKIFPLPSASSEPENVRILLRKIRTKLDEPRLPGDG